MNSFTFEQTAYLAANNIKLILVSEFDSDGRLITVIRNANTIKPPEAAVEAVKQNEPDPI